MYIWGGNKGGRSVGWWLLLCRGMPFILIPSAPIQKCNCKISFAAHMWLNSHALNPLRPQHSSPHFFPILFHTTPFVSSTHNLSGRQNFYSIWF